MVLEEFLGHMWGKKRWGDGAMRDLEVSLRAQVRRLAVLLLSFLEAGGGFPDLGAVLLSAHGSNNAAGPVQPAYDTMLERCGTFAYFMRFLSGASTVLGGASLALWFHARARHVRRIPGIPSPPVMVMLGCSCACMSVMAKMQYYDLQYGFAKIVLKYGDESMKMELAKIILNNHSDDKSLVEAVRRHYVADHLLSDQHQEQPLLRWRQRGSYVDSALLEKLKEYEAILEEGKSIK